LIGFTTALFGTCGPFTDVALDVFCPFVLEVFYTGITTGTTPTTYDPASPVSRLQMAAFLSRTVDGVVRRGSRRTPLNKFWTQKNVLNPIQTGGGSYLADTDGTDIWVASRDANWIQRLRASDGRGLETWTGATAANGIVVVDGTVWATGFLSPGRLYGLPSFSDPGGVTTVATNLGAFPFAIAYNGARFFTANSGPPGSVSIIQFVPSLPYPVTTVTTGFIQPAGILYDGSNMWVTDGTLKKLDLNAAILQTVTVGDSPFLPAFDGTNIWVPNIGSNSVSVVRASTGTVLATLSGNGLNLPAAAIFDGERILVTNPGAGTVSLWKAASLAEIGTVLFSFQGVGPYAGCSDGISFWVTMGANGFLAQF